MRRDMQRWNSWVMPLNSVRSSPSKASSQTLGRLPGLAYATVSYMSECIKDMSSGVTFRVTYKFPEKLKNVSNFCLYEYLPQWPYPVVWFWENRVESFLAIAIVALFKTSWSCSVEVNIWLIQHWLWLSLLTFMAIQVWKDANRFQNDTIWTCSNDLSRILPISRRFYRFLVSKIHGCSNGTNSSVVDNSPNGTEQKVSIGGFMYQLLPW